MGELELTESAGGIQGSSSGFTLLGWDTASLAALWEVGRRVCPFLVWLSLLSGHETTTAGLLTLFH